MNFAVAITPANLNFCVNDEEAILDAGLAAKINLPHGCKNGSCGACKCKLVSGRIVHDEYEPIALTPEEANNNYVLLCRARPLTNLVLDLPGFNNSFPLKTLPAKIEAIEKHGSVAIVKLRLPARQQFDFFAGQYIDIMYEGKNRSYSLANSPTTPGIVELHIRYRNGGVFSEAVWNKLQPGQILRFKGPLGSFTLTASQRPLLMVATGTGFAPLKSILEYMLATNNQRPIHLIWGNYQAADFYYLDLLDMWQQQLNLKVQLCINDHGGDKFYTGLVTEYVAANYADLSQHEIYACGNPGMIESLFNLATQQLQLARTNFFSDVFTPSN